MQKLILKDFSISVSFKGTILEFKVHSDLSEPVLNFKKSSLVLMQICFLFIQFYQSNLQNDQQIQRKTQQRIESIYSLFMLLCCLLCIMFLFTHSDYSIMSKFIYFCLMFCLAVWINKFFTDLDSCFVNSFNNEYFTFCMMVNFCLN